MSPVSNSRAINLRGNSLLFYDHSTSTFITLSSVPIDTQSFKEIHIESQNPVGLDLDFVGGASHFIQQGKEPDVDESLSTMSLCEQQTYLHTEEPSASPSTRHVAHQSAIYECDICSKTFAKKTYLVAHKKIHAKTHQCASCGMDFVTKKYLTAHKKIHEGVPSECDICGKSFAKNRYLVAHKKTHNQIHPSDFDGHVIAFNESAKKFEYVPFEGKIHTAVIVYLVCIPWIDEDNNYNYTYRWGSPNLMTLRTMLRKFGGPSKEASTMANYICLDVVRVGWLQEN